MRLAGLLPHASSRPQAVALVPAEAAPAAAPVAAASPPHALRGRLPNLSWRAASWEELRAHPRFTALPPVSELRLAGDERQYALVRQDSALWWSLHAGRLTSSILLASVGAREPAAARRLGLPAAAAGRRHAVEAAFRLGQPLLVPGAGAEGAETAAAAASNAAAVAAFNAAAPAPPPPSPPASPPPPAAAAAGRRRRRARPGPAIARSPEEAALRARCASASAGGDSGVRCAWGSAQEAGSLFSLLAAFPGARLREAGLCVPSPASLQALALPAEALARLPPLGASPDGVLAWPAGSPYAPPGGEGLETPLLEVVEVKNACPFRAHPAGGFALHDRGPPEALPPQHVAQLQLEMLCAGCGSGLLLCDSATRGAALFRMPRDDAYLALTLRLVASFAAAHVVPGGQGGGWPGGRAEVFGRGAEASLLAEWISRTRALARGAALTDFLACPRRPDGADPRPWLE